MYFIAENNDRGIYYIFSSHDLYFFINEHISVTFFIWQINYKLNKKYLIKI